jgi:hypothetical protein
MLRHGKHLASKLIPQPLRMQLAHARNMSIRKAQTHGKQAGALKAVWRGAQQLRALLVVSGQGLLALCKIIQGSRAFAGRQTTLTHDGRVRAVGDACNGVHAGEDSADVVLEQLSGVGVREEVVAVCGCCRPICVGAPAW